MNSRFIDRRHARRVVLAIAALPFFIGIAHAQTRSAPAPYRSAMEGYKPYTDEKIVDWKQANDSTGKIGGWREYAKEAQQPDAPDAADAGAKPAPAGKQAPDAKPVKP